MRKTSLFLLCAAAALAQNFEDRPGVLQSGTVTLSRNGVGYHLRYFTVVEPPPAHMSDIQITGGQRVSHNIVHREMTDAVNHQYFGYDLTAVGGPGRGQYTVSISPLTLDGPNGPEAAFVPLPKYPPPTVVNEGDTIALDLLVSADGKRKVVDYIQVSALPDAGPATSTAEPRDYSPDDGTVRINSEGLKVLVNGQVTSQTTGVTIKPGATLWLNAPNQGRYILSLVPQPGFQKAGAIRDNVITFQIDGAQYEVRTGEPILGSRGAWNLYVTHDRQFPSRNDGIYLGVDRLANVVSK